MRALVAVAAIQEHADPCAEADKGNQHDAHASERLEDAAHGGELGSELARVVREEEEAEVGSEAKGGPMWRGAMPPALRAVR